MSRPSASAVVHRHLDDGVHAVDVEPVRQQEHHDGAVLAHVGDGAAELAEPDAHGLAEGRCGPRCCSRTPRISGIVNSSHQTATVTKDTRTASAASASPNHAGLLHHEHVDQEQQAAAEIAERVAEGRNAIEILRLCDVQQQRIVEHHAAVEAHGAEHEQHRRREPLSLADEVQRARGAARLTKSRRSGTACGARRDRRSRRGWAPAVR